MNAGETLLHLARHGEVRGAGEVFYGQADLPLSGRGTAQAGALAARLRGVELGGVYASDLARTVEFAEIVAAPHGIEVQKVPALREMSLGVLEGMPIEEARQRHPDLATRRYSSMLDFRMPGGESLRDVAERVRPVIAAIVERHRGQAVLVASHQSVNRVVIADALGLPLERMFGFRQDFGCLNILSYGREGARVLSLNEVPEGMSQVGDRLRVSGIRFQGAHGWLASERLRPRPFRVDVVARLPLDRAGRSDDLADTVDYNALAEAVVRIGSGASHRLLESLGRSIGGEILRTFPALLAVEVTVHKPAPELTGEPDEVAVSVFLRRGDA